MNDPRTFDLTEETVRVAMAAVRRAARVCRAVQSALGESSREKQDKSPVTVADYASQATICQALQEAFPHDPIIAEEDAADLDAPEQQSFRDRILRELSAVSLSPSVEELSRWIDRGRTAEHCSRFWTLDPIDGTKGFLRGEQYAISLALIVEGRIVLGLLGCPNLSVRQEDEAGAIDTAGGSLFVARLGGGTNVLPLSEDSRMADRGGEGDGNQAGRIARVSPIEDPARTRVCESVESGHSAHDASAEIARRLGIGGKPARLDSQAKYAAVADGRAEMYLRLPTRPGYVEKIWDHAGGVLVVEEAGGRVTDIDGKPLEFTHGRGLAGNRGIVATNGRLHDRVLETLRAVGVAR